MNPRRPSTQTSSAVATSLGLLAIVLWSTTIACSRSLAEQLGALTGASAVYLVAGIIGCGALAAGRRLIPTLRIADRRYLFGCGGLMVAYTVLLYVAVGFSETRSQVIAVTVCNYLWPSLTLLLAVPLLGLRTRSWLLGAGTLIAIAGVALAVGGESSGADSLTEPWSLPGSWSWSTHAVSTLPALLAAVAWALYSNLSRRWGGAQAANAMPVFLLAAGLVLLALRACRDEHSVWTARACWEIAYTAVFPTLAAYVCWDAAARRGNLPLVAACSYLTPLLSVLVSSLYLDLPVLPQQWVAGILVVAGAVLCKASQRLV